MNTQPTVERTVDEIVDQLQTACSKVSESVAVLNALVKTADGQQSMNIGTAFCVDGRGYYVTALHVVAGSTDTFIVADSLLEARVLGVDESNDLALVQVPSQSGLTPVTFAAGLPADGEIVSGLGYGDQGLAVELTAYLARYCGQAVAGNGPDGLKLEGDTLQSALCFVGTNAVLAGYSGGPVVNEFGQVVSITVKGDDELGFVIGPGAADIQEFIKRHLPAA